jgi:hypothetical protein
MRATVNRRDTRLDILRGLFLAIIAAVHVPTPLSHLFQEPIGYTSAAEGFVFLGASLAGFLYGNFYRQTDWRTMSRRVWDRSKKIYLLHLAMVVPMTLIAWAAAGRLTPLANHFHDFILHPWISLALMPLLLHQPPLFDILPFYVIMLGITPLLLATARRRGWGVVLIVSALGWLAAQFRLDACVLGGLFGWLPLRLSSFNLCAWQFLWVSGLALGETALRRPIIRPEYRTALSVAAGAIALTGFLSRHGFWPQAWFNPDIFLWMDKWTLGPLRLLNFAAWTVLLLAQNPNSPTKFLLPLAVLGRHSLAVFSFHIPLAIAATTLIQVFNFSKMQQIVLGILVIAALFPWAAWLEHRGKRGVRKRTGVAPAITNTPAPIEAKPLASEAGLVVAG